MPFETINLGGSSAGALTWGTYKYSRVFGDLSNQDLQITPAFDTDYLAGHEGAASTYSIVNGSGIEVIPNNGTNWTDSGSWTAPYWSAVIADLLGFVPDRRDWLSVVLQLTIGPTHSDGTLTDAMLNIGTSHAGLQNYRTEQRTNVQSGVFGGGIVRTWGGAQMGTGPSSAYGSHQTVLEIQLRGGIVRNFVGTSFPSSPGQGMTEVPPTSANTEDYPLEYRNPGEAYQYDPATMVVAGSAYNFFGGSRTVTFQRLAIWHIDIVGSGV